MDEKRRILDELPIQARIHLDEQAEIVIDTVQEGDNLHNSCSECQKPLKEIYVRSEELDTGNGYDLVVLKCEKCNLLHAFWIQPFTYDETFLTPAKEDEHRGGRRIEPSKWEHVGKPQWGEGRQPKFSEKTAKVYEREISQLEDRNKRLNSIIQGKLAEMHRAGLSVDTINSARNKVLNYLMNNSATSKQLTSLFAAAIYEASHEELAGVGGFRRIGERISERQLEQIFGVTRKTIRKWRKSLPPHVGDFYL